MLFFNYQPCVYVATWQKDDTCKQWYRRNFLIRQK
nr:MAG TPA: hypothetical protein [Caudoviricetes sp.]